MFGDISSKFHLAWHVTT